MGDMGQMMQMMRDNMQMMMDAHSGMLEGTMPMSGTMPMGDMGQMGDMSQMMGYRLQMVGLHMQMMGLHMQMSGQMHGSTSDAMSMMGMDHAPRQGMMADEMTERQAAVAEAGRGVMPFDLEATTHIFEKMEEGGLQQVVADDPADADTIEQIRSHLSEQAERFAQGDFRDPEMIHGAAMPGLHELMMGAEQIVIAYSELSNGAQILYTTNDVDLVDAIHAWFDAQVADHGQHAAER